MASGKSVMALIKALKPAFRNGNNNDKVAFAVHSFFLASGYELTATGTPAFNPSGLTSASTDEVGIQDWNELDDQYAFIYVKPEKGSRKVLVKCLVMEGKLHVYYALTDGSSKHVELDVGNYVEENGGGNYSRQFKNMEMLVTRLESLQHFSSETSETNCVRRIKIESHSGPVPQTHISGRKRKELLTLCEEKETPANTTNVAVAGSVKLKDFKEDKVSMQHVYSIRRVKQKIGTGSDEADGLGILIEDKKTDIKEPHYVPATALMAEPVPASKAADSVPATQFHHLSDEMLPSPLKKISPRHLQDGEVYRGGKRMRR
ncbi:probable proteasome inhibitor isoform X1 [Prunus avium]|uniref:Probable proteasome inhibitor isoform X1 n=2 Tax=Prunus avium TaxID=42229 RepID=A0A6P5TRX7_PRUAV|nr:probable proteasome inhibitor isoform X1 [Prunus avium]